MDESQGQEDTNQPHGSIEKADAPHSDLKDQSGPSASNVTTIPFRMKEDDATNANLSVSEEQEQDDHVDVQEGDYGEILTEPRPETKKKKKRKKRKPASQRGLVSYWHRLQPPLCCADILIKDKPTGFEDFFADAPMTPEQHAENQALYDP